MAAIPKIPKRVYEVWKTDLDIHTCGGLLDKFKLQCSNCDEKFDSETTFAVHIEQCLRDAKHDTHYQVHMHANRLLMAQNRVALFCGASNQERYLQCGLCKMEFAEESQVVEHIRYCTDYKKEFGRFMNKARPLFSNMLHSYEQLSLLFQKYVQDDIIINMKKTRAEEAEKEGIRYHYDDLSDHFIEIYQDYIFVVTAFTDEVFVRYLKKMEDFQGVEVTYILPTTNRKRRRADYDDDSSDEVRRRRDESDSESDDGEEGNEDDLEEGLDEELDEEEIEDEDQLEESDNEIGGYYPEYNEYEGDVEDDYVDNENEQQNITV